MLFTFFGTSIKKTLKGTVFIWKKNIKTTLASPRHIAIYFRSVHSMASYISQYITTQNQSAGIAVGSRRGAVHRVAAREAMNVNELPAVCSFRLQ